MPPPAYKNESLLWLLNKKKHKNKEDLIKQCGTLLKTIKKLEYELKKKDFNMKEVEAEKKWLKEEI